MKVALVALAGPLLTTLMVLIGILMNHKEMNRLCRRVTVLESSLCAEMHSIRDQFRSDAHSSQIRDEWGTKNL